MSVCKAIRQEGAAKGTQCKFPAGENGYCGRHQRNKIYDDGVTEGRLWCRFFFRGCNNTVPTNGTACSDCKSAARADKPRCSHEGCNRTAKQDDKYCGKHERDKYRDQEKELGVKYCDIARSCFNFCEEGRSSCSSCLENAREVDNKRYAARKEMHDVINTVHKSQPPQQMCCYCGKDFAPFVTNNHKPSKACIACNNLQKKHDSQRKDRLINYAQRKSTHAEAHYAEYIRSATKRTIDFLLSFDEFKDIVSKPCFYCGVIIAGESIGVDRFDNSKGYTVENCRPCCDTCNRMKWVFHPLFFIEKCKILAGKPADPDFFKRWKIYYDSKMSIYSQYRNDAIKRGYDFHIPREEFEALITKPCYMCNYEGITGIDRKDNNVGYTSINCMSCCYSCNMSKADIHYSKVIQTAHMVAANWPDTTSITIPIQQKEQIEKQKKKPTRKCINIAERKGWKAASLYSYLKDSNYKEIMDTLVGVRDVTELQDLRAKMITLTYDDAVLLLKRFLNTMRVRRTRVHSNDTITHA